MLRGAFAAAVTPLRDAGEALDEDAFAPYVDFLAGAGLDGLLALGTTGEGMLLSVDQRMRAAQLYVEAGRGRLAVAVHAGAQSTWDTVELAAHASDIRADAVAVIGPPYFALDDDELLAHFAAAARACEPTPFYVYEFAARSGYAVPLTVLQRLREAASNFRGLKVSETPWERFTPYLVEGLDVLEQLRPPVIFVSNHSSHLDAPLVLCSLPDAWRSRTAVGAVGPTLRRASHGSTSRAPPAVVTTARWRR